MKIQVIIFTFFILFSDLSVGQTISCSRFTTDNTLIDSPRHHLFNMYNNTNMVFLTKPKNVIRLTLLILGNPVTNIPESYYLSLDPANSNSEWDAWTTTTAIGPPLNRNSVHFRGVWLGQNAPLSNVNEGDVISVFVSGHPANNDLYPTPDFLASHAVRHVGHSAEFENSVVVDDILPGETTTVTIGQIHRGVVQVSDSYGSTSKINMPTDNPDVTMNITAPRAYNPDRDDNIISTSMVQQMGQVSFNYGYPIVATIKANENARGSYSKTVTMTVNCP